ncbi:hypothetical protein TNCV_688121 [Trichonephila clavipes]|nr:hypothetical protein TNCV_688121 [Trichonephila clavipes]
MDYYLNFEKKYNLADNQKAPRKKCGQKEFLEEKEKKKPKGLIAVENLLPQGIAIDNLLSDKENCLQKRE